MKELVDRLIRSTIRREHGEALFALVDSARDPEVYDALIDGEAESLCLYTEKIPDVLARAAPYLVHLDRSASFTARFHAAWGRSWGVLARSRGSLEELRRHFKSLNIVRGPDGQRLVFRYYDPRVLRVYLPTCTPSELAQVFGPVREFVTEGEDCVAIRFTFDGMALTMTRHRGPEDAVGLEAERE